MTVLTDLRLAALRLTCAPADAPECLPTIGSGWNCRQPVDVRHEGHLAEAKQQVAKAPLKTTVPQTDQELP